MSRRLTRSNCQRSDTISYCSIGLFETIPEKCKWKTIDLIFHEICSIEDSKLIMCFLEALFNKFGIPMGIISNRGTSFISKGYIIFCRKYLSTGNTLVITIRPIYLGAYFLLRSLVSAYCCGDMQNQRPHWKNQSYYFVSYYYFFRG